MLSGNVRELLVTASELASKKPLKLLQTKVEDHYNSYCHPTVKPEPPMASIKFFLPAKRVKTVTPATAPISTPPQTSPAAEAMAVSIGLQDSYAAVAKQLNFLPQLNAADSIHQHKLLQEEMGEKSANLPSPTGNPSVPGPHIQVLRDARRKKFDTKKDLSRAYRNGLNTHFQSSNFANSAAAETAVKIEPVVKKEVDDTAVSKKKNRKRKPTKAYQEASAAKKATRKTKKIKKSSVGSAKKESKKPSKKQFMIDSSPLIMLFPNQQKIEEECLRRMSTETDPAERKKCSILQRILVDPEYANDPGMVRALVSTATQATRLAYEPIKTVACMLALIEAFLV